ncbi:MAG: amino acid ABC transporter permease [Rhizobiales bacterium]|nr:amino acid ABC transporter permease [Hyphomicrobiales bacterium]
MTSEKAAEPDVSAPVPAPADLAKLRIVPRNNLFRWVPVAIVVFAILALLDGVAFNPRFEWPTVGNYLFAPVILKGLLVTIWLTALCMALGLILGITIAVMRMSPSRIVSGFAAIYIWFFRGTPVLVQLIFWYNLAALFPTLSLGIPFGPRFIGFDTNAVITPLAAAVLGLALNEGAYMAEIVRAGIASVDHGQEEAARALGMTRFKSLLRIVLPQAMRFIVPPTGNETIGMLKMTSLVSVIALSDLLYSAQAIYSRTFETIPLLLVCCCWYLLLTSLLGMVQARIEAHYGRGASPAGRRRGEP